MASQRQRTTTVDVCAAQSTDAEPRAVVEAMFSTDSVGNAGPRVVLAALFSTDSHGDGVGPLFDDTLTVAAAFFGFAQLLATLAAGWRASGGRESRGGARGVTTKSCGRGAPIACGAPCTCRNASQKKKCDRVHGRTGRNKCNNTR